MAATGFAAAARAAAGRNLTVLVIDDERAIRDLLRLHLQNAGYAVVLAEDAIAGGKRLLDPREPIDLVILDAQLPYLSGIELASLIIADTTVPVVPMILITGHEHLAHGAERLDLPCLVKPFSIDSLMALVEKSLARAVASAAVLERSRVAAA